MSFGAWWNVWIASEGLGSSSIRRRYRAGADALPGLLAHAGFRVVKTKVTSALLRVGMEEETEDVALEFFAVTWAESGAVTPDISDAGDAWVEWC